MNSVVLLFKLEACRQSNFTQKCLDFVEEKAKLNSKIFSPDQDVINIICQEKTKIINFKYNVQVYFNLSLSYDEHAEDVKECFSKEEFEEGVDEPTVTHFCGSKETHPWENDTSSVYSSLWWKNAEKSPFYKQISSELYSEAYQKVKKKFFLA